jgi:hypothetical protein
MSIQKRTQDSTLTDIRIDHSITQNDTVYGRYSYNSVSTFTPGLLPPVTVAGLTISPGGNLWAFAGSAKDTASNFQLNYTHLFSSALVMNLVTSYLRIDNQSFPLNYGTNAATAFGYTGVNVSDRTSALTPVNISGLWGAATGYATVGDGAYLPLEELDNVLQFAGTVTWTKGIHNFKFGASLIHRNTLSAQDNYGIGELSAFNASTIQANLANFLEGNLDKVMRQNDLYPPHYLTYESGEFAQDDMRLSKHMTVNAGVRYDIITPFAEAVLPILDAKIRLGLFEDPYVDESKVDTVSDRPSSRDLARKLAARSMVRLRNEGQTLPLSASTKKVAVIGAFGDSPDDLKGSWTVEWQLGQGQRQANRKRRRLISRPARGAKYQLALAWMRLYNLLWDFS